jgi:hypothetical protein
MEAVGRACRVGEGEGYRRLGSALRRLPPGEKPWVVLVSALLDGSLPASAGGGEAGVFSRLSVDEHRLRAVVAAARAPARPEDPGETLSYREAAVVIGMSVPNVSWLAAAGLIATTGSRDRRITREDLDCFNSEYASTMEVARRLGIHPSSLRRALAKQGVEPVCALRGGMRLVWRRAEVLGTP